MNYLHMHGLNLICGVYWVHFKIISPILIPMSLVYTKAGGHGKVSSTAVALFTLLFFFIGPSICIYIPRCLTGVILLYLGIYLIQESLVDGYHDFGRLE